MWGKMTSPKKKLSRPVEKHQNRPILWEAHIVVSSVKKWKLAKKCEVSKPRGEPGKIDVRGTFG